MIQSIDLQATPGHLIRRAQQIAVAIFAEQLASADITPVQFAILNALLGPSNEVTGRGLQVDALGHVRDVLRGWRRGLISNIPINI